MEDAINTICFKEPFFTPLLLNLKLTPKKDVPTLGTDGENLFYNEDFIKTLTKEELCGVVLHEVLHCAFSHIWRKEDRDMQKWNVATDYAINPIVTESFAIPKGCLLDYKYYGMSAEEIYDLLPKENSEQSWCDKNDWPNEKGNKSSGIFEKFFGKKEKTEAEKEKERWEEIMTKTINKNYGSMPASMKRIVDKIYHVPVIDWASLITSLLSEDTNDYTFHTPDRRFLENDFFIPGTYSEDLLKDVVFAYDTSGSITEKDLQTFYRETINLFDNFSNIKGWIGVCDAYLYSFKNIDIKMAEYNDFGFIGGGGTDFSPIFTKIKEENLKVKALFYFTDLEGSFPEEEPDYPVFWLVKSSITDKKKEYSVPFGNVIEFLN